MKEPQKHPGMAKDKRQDLLRRPTSRRSTPTSPARSRQDSRETSSSDYRDTPSIPVLTPYASQPVLAPIPIATLSPAARNPFPQPGNIPHEAAAHAQRPSSDGNIETLRSFDHLRKAMEDGETSIFAPLQAALTDLIKLARSLEVLAHYVLCYILRPEKLFQNYLDLEHEITELEIRLPGFEVVAIASRLDATSPASDKHLQKLLYAIGV